MPRIIRGSTTKSSRRVSTSDGTSPEPPVSAKPVVEEVKPPLLPVRDSQNIPTIITSNVNNISLSLKRKYSKTLARQKLFSCSLCEYKTRWLANMQAHEERKHQIKNKLTKYKCNKCFKSFRFEHSYQRHSLECRRMDSANGPVGSEEVRSDSGKGRFRCAHCPERFASRQLCRIHIFDVHRTARRANTKRRRYQCDTCDFTTNNVKNLQHHCRVKHGRECLKPTLIPVNGPCNGDANGRDPLGAGDESGGKTTPVCYATPCDLKAQSSIIMQPFTLKDENSFKHFVKAVVYLPVYQKISEPITVSFQLTPTEQ